MESKGRKKGHSNERPSQHTTPTPLLLFATDFFGKVRPTSFRHNKWVMLFICDVCGFAEAKPIKNKSDAPEALEEFIKQIRKKCGVKWGETKTSKNKVIFGGIRSDNEPVLTSNAWEDVCNKYNIDITHSVPYEPEMNGKVERFVQTIKAALRTTCANIDPRVWDFCIEHIVKVLSLIHI